MLVRGAEYYRLNKLSSPEPVMVQDYRIGLLKVLTVVIAIGFGF